MSELSIRVTHRTEIDGRAVEKTIDIETIPSLPAVSQVAAPARVAAASPEPSGQRFEKVHTKGEARHVAVLDHQTGLMWSVESLGDPDDADDGITQEHCIERCRELRLLGFEDWRLPTRAELAGLVDDTRHEPAIDTDLFPGVKPRWHWTSTAAAWSSASAWGVGFYDGGVSSARRSGDGFALAVRRAGQ
ncbi:Lcl C-terminal domain-containing protein [Luteimonas notoginsengisoli]|uniref:DUF1566 domain-containing protein n=1 Tax=Luteimonas notoginsengisoli TaxID=1578200 RepID=A0ABV7UR48_9GAMM